MSTDRELLELAAKAAELEYNGLWFDEHTGLLVWEPPTNYESRDWNPLTDDGDALRLAVKLGVVVRLDPYGDCGVTVEYGELREASVYERSGPDSYAATRRAIVRAAAELGRKS